MYGWGINKEDDSGKVPNYYYDGRFFSYAGEDIKCRQDYEYPEEDFELADEFFYLILPVEMS